MPLPAGGRVRGRAAPRPRVPASWRAQPAPAGGAAPGQPAVDPYDYSADPIMQRIKAMGAQRLAEAQAAAIRARSVAESEYGGVQARLAREQIERPKALIGSLSKQNIGYGSEGGKQQAELARSMTEEAAAEQRAHQERLAGIEQGVLGVEREVNEGNIGAEEEAAARLQERLGSLQMQPGPRRPAGPVARALRGRVQGFRPQRPQPRPRPPARRQPGRLY